MTFRSMTAAALLALTVAMPAFAQQNDSEVVQFGDLNTTSIDQAGTRNRGESVQIGRDNLTGIRQNGSVQNSAACGQLGDVNECNTRQRDRNGH